MTVHFIAPNPSIPLLALTISTWDILYEQWVIMEEAWSNPRYCSLQRMHMLPDTITSTIPDVVERLYDLKLYTSRSKHIC
jgi:hypothetical protein